jgi:serine/threonine-protein kinase
VRASTVRAALLAALDDWSVCASYAGDGQRLAWLLEVARLADGDTTATPGGPRDPAAWQDGAQLTDLAEAVLAAKATPALLVAIGERLSDAGKDPVPFLRRAQSAHEDDFWANFTLGAAINHTGRPPAEAVRYFQAALALRPNFAVVHNNLGTSLQEVGQRDEAIERFHKAIRLDPKFAAAHTNLGADLYTRAVLAPAKQAQALYAEAVAELREAIRLDPEDARAHNNLGVVLAELGRLDEAIAQYRQALRLDPRSASAHTNLGAALARKGRRDEAIAHYRQAIHLDPRLAQAHYNLGNALQLAGQLDAAVRHFRQAIRLRPRFSRPHFHLANCLRDLGRLDESVAHYERATAIQPSDPRATTELRKALVRLGRGEEARIAWQKELAAGPRRHDAWDGYAELCLFLGQQDEYRRARKELLKRFGRSADPRVVERVGRAYLFLPASEDGLRQATNLIDRALASERARPGWLLPYFNFAKALAEYRAGRLKSALTLLDGDTQRILGPAPRLLLAMVQHRLGQVGAARHSFRAAVASYVWDARRATDREAWMYHLLRREAESVLASKP